MSDPGAPTQASAIQIAEHGASDKLQLVELPIPAPGAGEVLVRNRACGVNLIDIYQREGLYPMVKPAIMGNEAAGEIAALGADVPATLAVGQRVAYATAGPGCYTTHKVVAADRLVPLPDGIDTRLAGATLLRGMTAEFLACRLWPLTEGSVVVVTAAAGGVGVLLCQWLARRGARVIGVVGSKEKRERALANGCAEVVVGYAAMAKEVRASCPAGVEVVYDSVGKITFNASLACLRPRGCLVSYGNASGAVEPFAMLQLAKRGSLFVTRPTLTHYCQEPAELAASAASWFAQLEDGIAVPELVEMPLARAGDAHDLLASRKLEGLLVLGA